MCDLAFRQDSTASTSPMSKFEVLGEGDSFGPRLRGSKDVLKLVVGVRLVQQNLGVQESFPSFTTCDVALRHWEHHRFIRSVLVA